MIVTPEPISAPPVPSSSMNFPSPISPRKHDPALKPNPHPYAIKTTSTALLTRSNSNGYNTNAARHYYVPLSPNLSTKGNRVHRNSESLSATEDVQSTNISPRPLPVPPSFPRSNSVNGYTSADESYALPRRLKRADTLPSFPAPPTPAPAAVTLEDLPSNPKLWTPAQLSSYLVTALRVNSQSKMEESDEIVLPIRVAKDIAAFVKEARITGRTFLRLNEEDLNRMSVNKKWSEALLIASRNLRQNVLKGRIWGSDNNDCPSPGSASPSLPVHPFSSALYNSSSSSVDLSGAEDEQAQHPRRYRNGRVRGMVESFERSGSFSSDGGCDDGTDARPNFKQWIQREGRVLLDEEVIRSPSPERRRPLPEPPVIPPSNSPHPSIMEEEPTVEALLAASQGQDSEAQYRRTWGARAWEEMDLAPGVTVKRLPEGSNGHSGSPTYEEDEGFSTIIISGSGGGRGSGKGSGGRGRGREERRVVTAIFTPSHSEPPSEPVHEDDIFQDAEVDQSKSDNPQIPPASVEESSGSPINDVEKDDHSVLQLEQALADLAETRALVDMFRMRLEIVEQKISVLHERENENERERKQDQDIEASRDLGYSEDPSTPEDLPGTQALTANARETEHAPSSSDSRPFLSQLSSLVPLFEQQHFTPADSSGSHPRTPSGTDEYDEEPSSVSDLPSYVLLVGIGVCAIVLRVMFKKVGGKSGLGWRG